MNAYETRLKELETISVKLLTRIKNAKRILDLSRGYIVDGELELEFYRGGCSVKLNNIKIWNLSSDITIDNEIFQLEKQTYDRVMQVLSERKEQLRQDAINKL